MGRTGIDVARSNPDVVYAFVDDYEVAFKAEEGELDSYGRPKEGCDQRSYALSLR